MSEHNLMSGYFKDEEQLAKEKEMSENPDTPETANAGPVSLLKFFSYVWLAVSILGGIGSFASGYIVSGLIVIAQGLLFYAILMVIAIIANTLLDIKQDLQKLIPNQEEE
ncbi:MAG: hypothetical protein FH749_06415 [Firmicutes bacterium]|nr:hypothetical protein [Bacillota bacterium]